MPTWQTRKAEIVDWGTDKDEYKPGETAKAWITIRNTGSSPIKEVTLRGKVQRKIAGRFIGLGGHEITLSDLNIQPGGTESYKQTQYVPYAPGTYKANIVVIIDGVEIANLEKIITILRPE
ncbi:MAG: hypothetical protein ACM3QV_00345 [Caulobacteraceae bacterium]